MIKSNYRMNESVHKPEAKIGDLVTVRRHPDLPPEEAEEEEGQEEEEEAEEEEEEEEEEMDDRPNIMRALSWGNMPTMWHKDTSEEIKEIETELTRDFADLENSRREGIHVDYKPRYDPIGFFRHHERIQDRFFENEIDAFLRVMDLKEVAKNWRDMSTFHPQAGINYYDDIAQQWDTLYHTFNDQEWDALMKTRLRQWRDGPLIRFRAGRKDQRRYYSED